MREWNEEDEKRYRESLGVVSEDKSGVGGGDKEEGIPSWNLQQRLI